MPEMKCTNFVPEDEGIGPCKCPICGGFLKWVDGEPICNKCHTELIALPAVDEDTGEVISEEYGRICPISKPVK